MTFKLVHSAVCIGSLILLWQAWAAPTDDYIAAVEKQVLSRPITNNELFVRNPVPTPQSNIFRNGDIETPSHKVDVITQFSGITQNVMDNVKNSATIMDGFSHYDREVIFFCLVCFLVLFVVFVVLFARLKKEVCGISKPSCRSRNSSRSITKSISDFATDPFSLAPVYAKITVAAAPLAVTEEYDEKEECVEIIEEDLDLIV